MLIRELPPGERPMERLTRLGPQALRDTELIAIILGGQTAIGAAEAALRGGLARLQNGAGHPSLSSVRRARLRAVLEVCRRMQALEEPPARVIEWPADIAHHLVAKYGREPQERLGIVLLDAKYRVIVEREVYIGQHNQVQASPRFVLKHAIVEDARAVIVYHNHPSGDPRPSLEDSDRTAKFKAATDAVGVELFDHIIVGRKTYYSYREKRRL